MGERERRKEIDPVTFLVFCVLLKTTIQPPPPPPERDVRGSENVLNLRIRFAFMPGKRESENLALSLILK